MVVPSRVGTRGKNARALGHTGTCGTVRVRESCLTPAPEAPDLTSPGPWLSAMRLVVLTLCWRTSTPGASHRVGTWRTTLNGISRRRTHDFGMRLFPWDSLAREPSVWNFLQHITLLCLPHTYTLSFSSLLQTRTDHLLRAQHHLGHSGVCGERAGDMQMGAMWCLPSRSHLRTATATSDGKTAESGRGVGGSQRHGQWGLWKVTRGTGGTSEGGGWC